MHILAAMVLILDLIKYRGQMKLAVQPVNNFKAIEEIFNQTGKLILSVHVKRSLNA